MYRVWRRNVNVGTCLEIKESILDTADHRVVDYTYQQQKGTTMTLVLSDEAKAVRLAAERLMELNPKMQRFTDVDRLTADLHRHMREMKKSTEPTFIGTGGYTIFYWPWSEDPAEFMICLNVATLHGPTSDTVETQQFVYDDGEWEYDESCPSDWLD